jgi:hypothetical protein
MSVALPIGTTGTDIVCRNLSLFYSTENEIKGVFREINNFKLMLI